MYLDFIAEAVDVAVVLSDDAEVFFVEVIEVVVEVGVAYLLVLILRMLKAKVLHGLTHYSKITQNTVTAST